MKKLMIGSVLVGTLLASIAYNLFDSSVVIDIAKEKGKTYAKEKFNEVSPLSTDELANSLAGAQDKLAESKKLAAQTQTELTEQAQQKFDQGEKLIAEKQAQAIAMAKDQRAKINALKEEKQALLEKKKTGFADAINAKLALTIAKKEQFLSGLKDKSLEEMTTELGGKPGETLIEKTNTSIESTDEVIAEITDNQSTGSLSKIKNAYLNRFKTKMDTSDCPETEVNDQTNEDSNEKRSLKDIAASLLSKCTKDKS